MSLINRISRLFTADVHGILDNIEDPRTVIKQSIREMQAEISKHEQSIEHLKNSQTRLLQQKTAQEQKSLEIEEQVVLCLKANNAQLTKAMVRRKLESKKRIEFLGTEIAKIDKEIEQASNSQSNRLEQLKQIQDKFEIFGADDGSTCTETRVGDASLRVSEDEVEVAFLKTMSEFSAQTTTHKE